MFVKRTGRIFRNDFASFHRSPDLLDRHLHDIGVTCVTGTTEARDRDRLSVIVGVGEFQHTFPDPAFVPFVAVPETLGVGDQCGIAAGAFWCDLAPSGRKQTEFRCENVPEVERPPRERSIVRVDEPGYDLIA
ncbi:MAG: hypothetical protein KF762_14685 [Acidobacteria bacterium]|nr:hypothetical protein [Acidobacteriota bacterium]